MIRAVSLGCLLVAGALASAAAAPPIEKACQIQPTKSVCKLECAAMSASQSCDEPFNTCRSTCGLYDRSRAPAVTVLLDTMSRRTGSGAPPLAKQIEVSASALQDILVALRGKVIDKSIRPGTQVLILFAPGSAEVIKLIALFPFSLEPVPAEKDQLVVVFVLDERTFAVLQSNDIKIENLVSEAKELVSERLLR